MPFAANLGSRPQWLTFDCYGTLIQWDEGLVAAVGKSWPPNWIGAFQSRN